MLKRIRRIEGLSDERRLPRLGKIHLGVKRISGKSGKEYPEATDYFVCPDEVKEVYGDKPKDLEVILPCEDPVEFFPQERKYYRSSSAKPWCRGNGIDAVRVDDEGGGMLDDPIPCPCEFQYPDERGYSRCVPVGNLMVIIPRVSLGGIYQIDTRSRNSIVDINSGLDFVKERSGKLSNVPCILKLRPRESDVDGQKITNYTMLLHMANFAEMDELYAGIRKIQALVGGMAPMVPMALPSPSLESSHIPESVKEGMIENGAVFEDVAPEGGEVLEGATPPPDTNHEPPPIRREPEEEIDEGLAF